MLAVCIARDAINEYALFCCYLQQGHNVATLHLLNLSKHAKLKSPKLNQLLSLERALGLSRCSIATLEAATTFIPSYGSQATGEAADVLHICMLCGCRIQLERMLCCACSWSHPDLSQQC